MEGFAYGEFPQSDVGFPKGDSPEEFLDNMMSFLKEAAARLEKPAPLSAIILAEAASVAAWLAVLGLRSSLPSLSLPRLSRNKVRSGQIGYLLTCLLG